MAFGLRLARQNEEDYAETVDQDWCIGYEQDAGTTGRGPLLHRLDEALGREAAAQPNKLRNPWGVATGAAARLHAYCDAPDDPHLQHSEDNALDLESKERLTELLAQAAQEAAAQQHEQDHTHASSAVHSVLQRPLAVDQHASARTPGHVIKSLHSLAHGPLSPARPQQSQRATGPNSLHSLLSGGQPSSFRSPPRGPATGKRGISSLLYGQSTPGQPSTAAAAGFTAKKTKWVIKDSGPGPSGASPAVGPAALLSPNDPSVSHASRPPLQGGRPKLNQAADAQARTPAPPSLRAKLIASASASKAQLAQCPSAAATPPRGAAADDAGRDGLADTHAGGGSAWHSSPDGHHGPVPGRVAEAPRPAGRPVAGTPVLPAAAAQPSPAPTPSCQRDSLRSLLKSAPKTPAAGPIPAAANGITPMGAAPLALQEQTSRQRQFLSALAPPDPAMSASAPRGSAWRQAGSSRGGPPLAGLQGKLAAASARLKDALQRAERSAEAGVVPAGAVRMEVVAKAFEAHLLKLQCIAGGPLACTQQAPPAPAQPKPLPGPSPAPGHGGCSASGAAERPEGHVSHPVQVQAAEERVPASDDAAAAASASSDERARSVYVLLDSKSAPARCSFEPGSCFLLVPPYRLVPMSGGGVAGNAAQIVLAFAVQPAEL